MLVVHSIGYLCWASHTTRAFRCRIGVSISDMGRLGLTILGMGIDRTLTAFFSGGCSQEIVFRETGLVLVGLTAWFPPSLHLVVVALRKSRLCE